MPLRRNLWQYRQLSDSKTGHIAGLREAVAVKKAYRPPPRPGRHGSCPVLATVDHR